MTQFPPSSGDSSKPILQASVSKGDPGDPGRILVADGPFIGIPCDNDDSNPVYTNAESRFFIMEGSSILAQEGAQNGWTLAEVSSTDCTISISGFTVSVTNIAADTASFVIRAYYAGEADLYATVYVKRINKGEQGNQGIQGVQGDAGVAGDTGPSGQDGTGLVVRKFTVTVEDEFPGTVSISDNGGNMRITFGTDPNLELGEAIEIRSVSPAFTVNGVITAVVGSGVYDTDITYQAPGTLYVWSLRNFRKGGPFPNSTPNSYEEQDLYFPNIFPIGAKLDELAVVRTAEDTVVLFFDAGYVLSEGSGYNRYMSSEMVNQIGDISQVNLWDPDRFGYSPLMLAPGSTYRNLYLRARKYLITPAYYWNVSPVQDMVHEIFISYKFFDTSLT